MKLDENNTLALHRFYFNQSIAKQGQKQTNLNMDEFLIMKRELDDLRVTRVNKK